MGSRDTERDDQGNWFLGGDGSPGAANTVRKPWCQAPVAVVSPWPAPSRVTDGAMRRTRHLWEEGGGGGGARTACGSPKEMGLHPDQHIAFLFCARRRVSLSQPLVTESQEEGRLRESGENRNLVHELRDWPGSSGHCQCLARQGHHQEGEPSRGSNQRSRARCLFPNPSWKHIEARLFQCNLLGRGHRWAL